jgi:ABC-type branched-subunit amino acid transport system substrate-binding protein
LIILETKLIMSHIRIVDITPSPDLEQLLATLTVATIDDVTGSIVSPPHSVAKGSLNVRSLVALNKQIIENFQAATTQDRYFGGIKIPEIMVCQVADPIDKLRTDIQQLQAAINLTLSQDTWSTIREGLLGSLIGTDPAKTIRVVIRTDDVTLQALPLEGTSFITNVLGGENRNVSVVFAPQKQPKKLTWLGAPRILLVLGSQKNIEQVICIDDLKKHFPAPAMFRSIEPQSPAELLKIIADEVFDVIIIIGHSYANQNGIDGRIQINDQDDSISIQELTKPFQDSVNRGLKLVILAGCSSIGVARALASNTIGVPNVIAFRVPVHYRVLQLFFDRLLTKWVANGQSLEVALTNTRAELSLYDRDCPGASILPILLTSPYDPPLLFPVAKIQPELKSGSIFSNILHMLVFQSLVTIKFRAKKVKVPPIVFIGIAAATLFYAITRPAKLAPTCNSTIGDGISCGEDILLREPNISPQADKQAGANAIANNDYPRAIQFLNQAWAAKKDPETLIMLENAKLADRKVPIKSIAVTIPGSQSTPLDIPTSMLKAVSFAQQQWNADPNHTWKLEVVLVDDRNDKNYVSGLATNILKRGVMAGIGSYSSEVTLSAKDIYKSNRTVLISSTSTSSELTNKSSDNFFFRVCSNNEISGKQIADYLKRHKYTKIALFHTNGRSFSDSMTKALKANIQGIDIVKEFNFEGKGAANNYLQAAKQAGAQAIVLIPDAYTSEAPERNRLLSIVRENNGDLPIIGNEVVKDQTLFNFSSKQLQKLVISLPWHSSSYQNNTIALPDFWGNKSQLDHRIAMTYDATQVVIKALDLVPIDRDPHDARQQVQAIIKDPSFNINGITGEISFKGSDRSQPINSLVQPNCTATKCEGFQPAR